MSNKSLSKPKGRKLASPRPKRDKGRIRKQREAQILRAAEDTFAAFGFEGTTTQEVAKRAGLPKANIHYYFETKESLYRAVLGDILALWLSPFDHLSLDSDPAEALEFYIRAKMEYSRIRPQASKVFANEIIRGAPILGDYLKTELRQWSLDKARVIQSWIDGGRMADIEPLYLLFAIWAITQHYADFETQVSAVLGRTLKTKADFDEISDFVVRLIFAVCGLTQKAGLPKKKRAGT